MSFSIQQYITTEQQLDGRYFTGGQDIADN